MPTTRIPYGILDGRYVNAAGDTMLGELTLAGAPTLDLHAATKKYVDDAVGVGGHTHTLDAGATDVTATSAEVNLLDLSGLSIGQVLRATGAASAAWGSIQVGDLPAGIDAAKIADGSVSNTEYQYLNGVTSAIQTQLDAKAADSIVLKKDGSVGLTANWDIGDTRKILADELAARDADGLKLYDDGGAGIFIEDGGNVGVGTIDPRGVFEVAGDLWGKANYPWEFRGTPDPYSGGIRYDTYGAETLIVAVGDASSRIMLATGHNVRTDIGIPNKLPSNPEVTVVSGKVGIGTASPWTTARMHVASDTEKFIALFAESGITPEPSTTLGAAYRGRAILVEGDGGAYYVGRDVTNDIEFLMGTSVAGGVFTGSGTDHNYWIKTNNTTRVAVTKTGNVGINTWGPDRKLEVVDASSPQLRLTHTDGSVYTDFQTVSDGYLYINPSGNRVGIGTSSPSQALEVAGSAVIGVHDTYHKLYVNRYSSAGYAYIVAGDIDRDMGVGFAFQYRNDNGSLVTGLSIDANGKVGIGIAPSARKLEIMDSSASQLRLTQLATTNYVDFLANASGDLTITPSGSKVLVAKALEVDGAFDHDGSTFGVFGVTPASRVAAYAVTNAITDRSFDADNTTIAELADVVATIISDLKTYGFFQ